MIGQCKDCKEMQGRGVKDYCCAECALRFAGLGDYMTKDAHGTVIVDLGQKIKDSKLNEGTSNGKD